jgi:hypothetical protein
MLALLLDHSPAFLTGELMLGLSLGLFGVALVGTARKIFRSSSGGGDKGSSCR